MPYQQSINLYGAKGNKLNMIKFVDEVKKFDLEV